ncbi:MAG: hypothetical protein LUC24_02605, partial [Bacteroidales bacterium]|nr:hypothetical protein [Bacteroidales bacterium]
IGGAYAVTVTITDTDKNLDDTIEGIYAVNGGAYYSSGTATDQQWEMQIVQDDINPDLLYIDGLAPACEGWYASYGSAYCAQGYLSSDEEQLIIPSQMLDGITMSGYYVGFGACVEYDDGFYYSSSWPDVTFTKQSDGSWISDYGFFIMGCTSNDISTFSVFFDVSIPGLVITKVD